LFAGSGSYSMFPGVLIGEEVDRVGDKRSGDTTIVDLQIFLKALLNMSIISACFFDEVFFFYFFLGLISSSDGLSGFFNP